MKTQSNIKIEKTFYVSYTLYEPHDVLQHDSIRQFCVKRFKGKYLQENYFVCTTFLSASKIAKELYQTIRDTTGHEGQVVVIDCTQGRSTDKARVLATAPAPQKSGRKTVKIP